MSDTRVGAGTCRTKRSIRDQGQRDLPRWLRRRSWRSQSFVTSVIELLQPAEVVRDTEW